MTQQLQTCICALETKQPESLIGMYFCRILCRLCWTLTLTQAQSGGHEVWQAIWDMIKNVSEVMLSALPNFWRISKSFLDGKFKRASRANNLFFASCCVEFNCDQTGGPSGSRRSPS